MSNPPTPPPRPQRAQRITPAEAQAVVRKLETELSQEERDLLNEAGRKIKFWTNVGVVLGFMSFSLPFSTRIGTRYRFIKGLAAGTAGCFLLAPVGMLYGANAAEKVIMTHPNHEHLLKVLQQTRSALITGQQFGSGESEMSPNNEETQSWPSERQEAYPSLPSSRTDSFDGDSLLTDDEINRQNQGATFTRPEQPSQQPSASKGNPSSAWDALRNRAQQQSPPPAPKQEKDVWGEDK